MMGIWNKMSINAHFLKLLISVLNLESCNMRKQVSDDKMVHCFHSHGARGSSQRGQKVR